MQIVVQLFAENFVQIYFLIYSHCLSQQERHGNYLLLFCDEGDTQKLTMELILLFYFWFCWNKSLNRMSTQSSHLHLAALN
jgi:hypothetical protein